MTLSELIQNARRYRAKELSPTEFRYGVTTFATSHRPQDELDQLAEMLSDYDRNTEVPRTSEHAGEDQSDDGRIGGVTNVYTDGSAVPNPGKGGWGVVVVRNGEKIAEKYGSEPETTNNRMELRALIEGFKLLAANSQSIVRSDSQLCVRTITEWAPKWRQDGWRRRQGPIKNLDLVKKLLQVYEAHPQCSVQWTPGHSGDRWNEYADRLAAKGSSEITR